MQKVSLKVIAFRSTNASKERRNRSTREEKGRRSTDDDEEDNDEDVRDDALRRSTDDDEDDDDETMCKSEDQKNDVGGDER